MIKTRTKSIIIILVTLVIGIAIGFEISEIFAEKRFENFRRIREPKGFVSIFDEIIKPDKDQKPVIDSIVLQHHAQVDTLISLGRQQIQRQIDSLRAALKPHLTDEQMKRFDTHVERMKKGPVIFRRRVPPPPPGEGGRPQGFNDFPPTPSQ